MKFRGWCWLSRDWCSSGMKRGVVSRGGVVWKRCVRRGGREQLIGLMGGVAITPPSHAKQCRTTSHRIASPRLE